ncbi:MAG: hypothetical protein LBB36_05920 [Fibromonadaceae bacterium]|jgi:hypothetical protein|nr:hypothetical protein [Fibromonadaceae bacterium]
MGLLYPSSSKENSKKIGLKHWVRVWILLLITGLLTWYGKIYKPLPMLTYVNEFAVWIVPHKNGLGALVALPNDNNDSTKVRTGLRIWLSPPDSLLAFERSGARYRGKNIVVIGDSLEENLKRDMLSTLDSTGNFYWLGPLGTEQTGEDVFAELKLIDDNPRDYILDLVYEGCKIRFFGSQTAVDSSVEEPLSVAILMFKPADENEPSFKNSRQIQSLVWNGKKEEKADSSRIALNYAEAFAMISYNEKRGVSVKRMHIKHWNPEN